MNPVRPGKLITFEGGEGVGKSTQVRGILQRLTAAGIPAVSTREPGGTPHAETLRKVLLSGFGESLGTLGETILFTAARIDHMDKLIIPTLATGHFVVCDRFIDSTLAYQGALGQVPGSLIAGLERLAIGDKRPDLTVLLDLPPRVGLARAAQRRGLRTADRFEREDESFHAGLRRAFLAIAEAEPDRFLVVDATRPKDDIAEVIWAEAARRFSLRSEHVS